MRNKLISLIWGVAFVTATVVAQDSQEPVKWLRLAAEQGDPHAQVSLGDMYDLGMGVPQDSQEAMKWYRLAAEQGDPRAQTKLVEVRNTISQEAMKRYRLAAEQGDPRAQTMLGAMYAHGAGVPQDYQEALEWYRLAAEQGDPRAQTVLGAMYQLGDGVPQDYQEALKWYRLAAEQGDPRAQVQLGFKLQQEALTLQQEALTLQLEAEQGNPFAQATLGNMYNLGDGVSQNLIQAHKWFNLAASKATGEEREGYRSSRDAVAEDMTALQIAEAQRLAREWQLKTWEQLIAVRDEQ